MSRESYPSWLRRLVPHTSARRSEVFRRRHSTFLAPCDFDVSPYFEIVKFNSLRSSSFDYRRIRWEGDDAGEVADVAESDTAAATGFPIEATARTV